MWEERQSLNMATVEAAKMVAAGTTTIMAAMARTAARVAVRDILAGLALLRKRR
jgi:hypothetical protein